MAKLIIMLDGVTLNELTLDQPKITLGRAPSNDVHLDDGTVSGKHAVFHVLGKEVFVEDLDSTNGTLVNGQRVHRRQLRHGDVLRIGQHELKFVDEAAQTLESTVIISSAQRESLKSPKEMVGKLKILNGPKAGEMLELNKPYNTVGKPGVQVAVVAKRAQGFFLVPMAVGNSQGGPTLNNQPVGASSQALKNGDVLEVAGVRLEFQQQVS
ncbi:FHA domain-containing protein [Sulfurivermis fontis]|uniref:FHA domain-containing protein n=1 Tax=Sulfurivermis fontis TaxID=1972068 RepID=UPI000FD98555|nr:FHA domain-containing protein [Sulfurivermis fontis]